MSEELEFRKKRKLKGTTKKIIIGVSSIVAIAAVAVPTALTLTGESKADAIKYNITISSNIEGYYNYNLSVEEGTKISELKTMLKAIDGYSVAGIYKDEALKHEYLDSEYIKSDVKIYIKLTAKTFTVNVYSEERGTSSDAENYELKQLESEQDDSIVDTLTELKEVLFEREKELLVAKWAEDSESDLKYSIITFEWVNARGEKVNLNDMDTITEDMELYPSYGYDWKDYRFGYSFTQSDFRNSIQVTIGGKTGTVDSTYHYGSIIKISAKAKEGYRISEFTIKNGESETVNIFADEYKVVKEDGIYYEYSVKNEGNLFITYNEVAQEFSLGQIPDGVIVKKVGESEPLLSNGKIKFGDQLEIVYEEFEGYYDVTFGVVGAKLVSGNIYSVYDDVTINYSYAYEYDYLDFEKVESGWSVTGLNNSETREVVIPNTYRGERVTEIKANAFENAEMTRLTIGENIKTIGREAFKNCVNLTQINYNAIEADGLIDSNNIFNSTENAFSNIFLFVGKSTSGTTVSIGDKVKVIPAGLFASLEDSAETMEISNITAVNIGSNVNTIGAGAFMYCTNLTSISIPNSVLNIETGAFGMCVSLADISLSESLDAIDDFVFYGCISIKEIEIPSSVLSIGRNSFAKTGFESITITSNIKSIGENAFDECSKLRSVIIDSAEIYETISADMFKDLSEIKVLSSIDNGTNGFLSSYFKVLGETYNTYVKVTDVSLFEFVRVDDGYEISKYIGSDENVIIPTIYDNQPIVSIGNDAFYNCGNLKRIVVSNNIKSISTWAFHDCINLEVVDIEGEILEISEGTFAGCTKLKTINIPLSLQVIGSKAFFDCSTLASIKLPENLISISNDAFSSCTSLQSIILPNSVTSIGNSCFYNCTSLEIVELSESLETIGNFAFHNCSSILSIEIPNSVVSLGEHAFDGCTNLHTATIGNGIKTISVSAFSSCYSLVSVTLPNNLIEIADNAFWFCKNLEEITLPDSVTRIGASSFSECNKLNKINLPANLRSIGIYAFYNCRCLTSINIPNNITEISASTFSGCSSINSVSLPAELTTIGEFAFWGCSSLSSITIPNTTQNIFKSAFAECANLGSIIIPASVNTVGEYAFNNCISLTNVTLENGIVAIAEYAFQGCSNLYNIIIPSSVKTIGDFAFDGCTNLTTVTIESSDVFNVSGKNESKLLENATKVYVKSSIDTGRNDFLSKKNFDICSIDNFNLYIKADSYSYLYIDVEDGKSLLLCSSLLRDVYISATYDGANVVSIEPWAFDENEINTLTFSKDLTKLSISNFAFSYAKIKNIIFEGNSESIQLNLMCREGFFNCEIERLTLNRELIQNNYNALMDILFKEIYVLEGVDAHIREDALSNFYIIRETKDNYNIYASPNENYSLVKIPRYVTVSTTDGKKLTSNTYIRKGETITINITNTVGYTTTVYANGTIVTNGSEIVVSDDIEITINRQIQTFNVTYHYGEGNQLVGSTKVRFGQVLNIENVSYERNNITYDVVMWVNRYGEEIDLNSIASDIEIYAVYENLDGYVEFENYILYKAEAGYVITEYLSYSSEIDEVIFPTEYNGEKIVAIGNDLFNFKHIKRVVIPAEIEYLCTWAFAVATIDELVIEASENNLEVGTKGREIFFNASIENVIVKGNRNVNWEPVNFVGKYVKTYTVEE